MNRVKTDIRITPFLANRVNEVCATLGITKNSFYVMATTILLVGLTPFIRNNLLKNVDILKDEFDKALSLARKLL